MKDLQQFLAEHGISEEIGGQGRYVRFERGEDISVHFAAFGAKLERFARSVSGQSGGFVIRRVGWQSSIPPQLRPDVPVGGLNRPSWTFHPDDPEKLWGYRTTKSGKSRRVRALSPSARERHIAKYHPEGNRDDVHVHFPTAKYAIPPGAWGKRLDVPLPDRILDSQRVFFVIEGSVKTDAILSTGEAAFGVPSVTLWPAGGVEHGPYAPELDAFIDAMSLRDKQVVIVPDADWCNNPLVIMQAMLCRAYLRDRDIDAVVAAPPLLNRQVIHDPDYGDLKGVDDFLAAGHTLDELSVLQREPSHEITRLFARMYYDFRKLRTALNASDALRTLSLYADDNGHLFKSLHTFARILGGCGRKEARKRLADLELMGAIEVEGSLDAHYKWDRDPSGVLHDYDWNNRPRIKIKPEYRARQREIPLRDLPIGRLPEEATHRVEATA